MQSLGHSAALELSSNVLLSRLQVNIFTFLSAMDTLLQTSEQDISSGSN
jgi:hypothetical protein